eukprot:365209-Chlamydomonas_euryale.AAC.10
MQAASLGSPLPPPSGRPPPLALRALPWTRMPVDLVDAAAEHASMATNCDPFHTVTRARASQKRRGVR